MFNFSQSPTPWLDGNSLAEISGGEGGLTPGIQLTAFSRISLLRASGPLLLLQGRYGVERSHALMKHGIPYMPGKRKPRVLVAGQDERLKVIGEM